MILYCTVADVLRTLLLFGNHPATLPKTTRSTQFLHLPSFFVKPQYHDTFITQSASSLPLTPFNPSEEDKPGFESRSWLQKNTKALVFGTFVAIALSATCLGQIYGSPQLAQLNEHTSSFIAQVCATGFYQAFSIVFLSEIWDKTFLLLGSWRSNSLALCLFWDLQPWDS